MLYFSSSWDGKICAEFSFCLPKNVLCSLIMGLYVGEPYIELKSSDSSGKHFAYSFATLHSLLIRYIRLPGAFEISQRLRRHIWSCTVTVFLISKISR